MQASHSVKDYLHIIFMIADTSYCQTLDIIINGDKIIVEPLAFFIIRNCAIPEAAREDWLRMGLGIVPKLIILA